MIRTFKFCKKCKIKSLESGAYCRKCGEELISPKEGCKHCGNKDIKMNDEFCTICGQNI
jgi:hypothetical protein